MRTRYTAVLILALAVAPAVDADVAPAKRPVSARLPASVEPAVIPGYRLLSPDLAVGGMLSDEALAQLVPWGVRTVIDLRTEAEGTAPEKTAVLGLGLRYVSVPVSPATLGWETAQALRDALDTKGAGPVLLHCRSGGRVAAALALVARLRGKSVDEALAAGREAGLPLVLEMRVRQIAESPLP